MRWPPRGCRRRPSRPRASGAIEAVGANVLDLRIARDRRREGAVVDGRDLQAARRQLPGPAAGRGAQVDHGLALVHQRLLASAEKDRDRLGQLLRRARRRVARHPQAGNAERPRAADVGVGRADAGGGAVDEQHVGPASRIVGDEAAFAQRAGAARRATARGSTAPCPRWCRRTRSTAAATAAWPGIDASPANAAASVGRSIRTSCAPECRRAIACGPVPVHRLRTKIGGCA